VQYRLVGHNRYDRLLDGGCVLRSRRSVERQFIHLDHFGEHRRHLHCRRPVLHPPAISARQPRRLPNPAEVRSIGFEAIQVSALGPIPEEEIIRICAGEGLTICATHESGERILNSPHEIVERLRKLNCKYTAYPFPRNIDLADLDAVRKLARQLDASGAVLRQAGQVLTYQNHALEFLKLDDKTVLDIIYDESNEQNLQAEIDTYCVQLGGGDPAA
jgi:sugar phosphate isomerase/epimerase